MKKRLSRLGRLRIKTMDLYVARTFLLSWVACATTFIGLFVVIETFAKLDRFLEQEGSFFSTLLKYNLAMIPTLYTNYMGPILTSAAALFTVALLNRNNEIQALKTAGVSVYRMLAPVFVFAFLLIGGAFYLQEVVLPEHRSAIRTALAISKSRPLQPDPYMDVENGYHISVGQYSTTQQIGRMVEVTERYEGGNARRQVNANQIEWVDEGGDTQTDRGHWLLHDGSVQRWDENGQLVVDESQEGIHRLKAEFTRMRLDTTLRPIDLETKDQDISYLSWRQLRDQYERQKHYRHLAVKLHHHFAFPLAHLLLLLLGLPLAFRLESRNLFIGMGASFLIGAAFFLVSSMCASIGIDADCFFSPTLAAWFPIMLFGALGLTLFDNMPT